MRVVKGGRAETLPHSPEAERAVLGAVLVSPSSLPTVRASLLPADFYGTAHRIIYAAALAVVDAGTALDIVTLRNELGRIGKLEDAGGVAYVGSLTDGVPHSSNVAHYAQIVLEKSRDRIAVRAADAYRESIVSRNGHDPGEDREAIWQAATELKAALEAQGSNSAAREFASEDLADIVARPMLPTPWAAEGLIAVSDIGIISGRGGVGKSWLALGIALDLAAGRAVFGRFAVSRPYNVAVVDLESRPWEADQRLHRIVAGSLQDPAALRGRVRIVRERIRFDRHDNIARLLASLASWQTDFLILDSFRRLHAGDENKSEVISALFLDAFDRIRSDLNSGVIIVDHERKPTGDPALDGSETSLRGSTDKRNMADWHIGVEARQEHLAVIPTKTRHSRLPDPFLLQLQGLEDDGVSPVAVSYVGGIDRASNRVQDACIALLQESTDLGMLRGELINRLPYSQRSITSALSSLKSRQLVTTRKDGKQVRYSADKLALSATSANERKPYVDD